MATPTLAVGPTPSTVSDLGSVRGVAKDGKGNVYKVTFS